MPKPNALDELLASQDTLDELPKTDVAPMDIDSQDGVITPTPDDNVEMNAPEDEEDEVSQAEEPEQEDSELATDEPTDWEQQAKDNEAQLASKTKQQQDQQSYFQNQINELKAQLEAVQNPPEPEMTDEELNDLFYENPAKAMKLMQAKLQAPAPSATNAKLEWQQEEVRASHEDYDDVVAFVQKAAQTNPALEQEIFSSANPAKAAYEKGKLLMEESTLQSDPEAYKAKLREELLLELQSEQQTTKPKRLRKANNSSPGNPKKGNSPSKNGFTELFGNK